MRQRPLWIARRAAPQARIISRIRTTSRLLSRETATNEGKTASASAPAERGERAEGPAHDPVERGHPEHPGDRLRQQQAERGEAEQLGAQRLHPQPERGLVDGDQPTGVEGDEEEVVQRAQHRLDAGGVEDVGVAVLGESVGVQHGGQCQHRSEREVAQHGLRARVDERTALSWRHGGAPGAATALAGAGVGVCGGEALIAKQRVPAGGGAAPEGPVAPASVKSKAETVLRER